MSRPGRPAPASTPPPVIAAGRRRLFWALTLTFPFLLLLLLEGALRLAGYGDDLALVQEKRAFGREWYALNTEVGKRYFAQGGIAVPQLYDELFERRKSPTTKRIFMLGESTMAGYPFDYNATPSRLLQDRLRLLLPGYHVEVINAALAAVNSYTVLDFIEELTRYEPDAFVVYVGHNEFYGALGVASSEASARGRFLTRLSLRLRTVRVVQLLKNALALVRPSAGAAPTERRDASLMEVLARDKTIPYRGEEYLRARAVFGENLREIIGVAAGRGVPIVLCTLASNLRDQEPLVPAFSPGLGESERSRWTTLFREGAAAESTGAFQAAAALYRRAIAVDSLHADAHYRLARCLDTLGEKDAARTAYGKARDFDALRFRASAEFNELIRSVCRESSVPLADAEGAFAAASPDGIVGANLMMEHLHPNFDGYLLLAATMARTLGAAGILAEPGAYQWPLLPGEPAMKRRARVTSFDLQVAGTRIRELTGRWPFRRQVRAGEPADSMLQELVDRYVRKRIAWSQAHFDLAAARRQAKEYDSAVIEYEAVAKIVPFSYYPWMMIGDTYQLAGERDSAAESYRRGLRAEESPYLHVRLGMLYYEMEKTDSAIGEFERTLGSEAAGSEKMSAREVSTIRYFLGSSYGKKGDLASAKRNLQLALQVDPTNKDARAMLAQIP